MKKKTQSVITTVIFLVLIFGVTIVNLLTPEKEFSENENRVLTTLPDLSVDRYFSGKFGTEFEKYTTDQFVGRDYWVGMKTAADRALQKKDSGGVYFAEDGYLIEKHSEQEMNTPQLEKNLSFLKQFITAQSDVLGTEHVKALLAPTAAEILSDKLPAYAPNFNQEKVLNQLENDLPQGTFINLVPLFTQHKEEELYYHTDHHWTTYGAFLAYEEWAASAKVKPWEKDEFRIEQVTDEFYGTTYSKANYYKIQPDKISLYYPKKEMSYHLDINDGKKQMDSLYDLSFLEKKDKYSIFLGTNNPKIKITSSVKNGKKLLLIKDSYAHSMVPFLANHFEEIHMLDFRYYHQGAQKYIEENEITDVLVLYNLVTFAEETNIGKLVR